MSGERIEFKVINGFLKKSFTAFTRHNAETVTVRVNFIHVKSTSSELPTYFATAKRFVT